MRQEGTSRTRMTLMNVKYRTTLWQMNLHVKRLHLQFTASLLTTVIWSSYCLSLFLSSLCLPWQQRCCLMATSMAIYICQRRTDPPQLSCSCLILIICPNQNCSASFSCCFFFVLMKNRWLKQNCLRGFVDDGIKLHLSSYE